MVAPERESATVSKTATIVLPIGGTRAPGGDP
jgi:hypothetical protein